MLATEVEWETNRRSSKPSFKKRNFSERSRKTNWNEEGPKRSSSNFSIVNNLRQMWRRPNYRKLQRLTLTTNFFRPRKPTTPKSRAHKKWSKSRDCKLT